MLSTEVMCKPLHYDYIRYDIIVIPIGYSHGIHRQETVYANEGNS